jgi:hypothetical protein
VAGAIATINLLAVLDRDTEMRRMISNDDSPLPDTEVHYLRSEHVGDEFKIFVGHPHSSDTAPPGVLFMGDPWGDFGTAVLCGSSSGAAKPHLTGRESWGHWALIDLPRHPPC